MYLEYFHLIEVQLLIKYVLGQADTEYVYGIISPNCKGSVYPDEKKTNSLTYFECYGSMQRVSVSFVRVLRYLSLMFLPQPRYNVRWMRFLLFHFNNTKDMNSFPPSQLHPPETFLTKLLALYLQCCFKDFFAQICVYSGRKYKNLFNFDYIYWSKTSEPALKPYMSNCKW